MKLVVSLPKTKQAFQKDVDATSLLGKKIGEKVSGEAVGLAGYEIELTGGSDKQGFPMRKDMPGIGRKRLLLSSGPGFHPLRKGQRKRKSVRGNTVSEEIAQLNAKVLKEGTKPIAELWSIQPKQKEEKTEEKKEAKAEHKEAKPVEKPVEAAEKAEAKMGVKPVA